MSQTEVTGCTISN